jgi:hypothetical protein
MSRKERRKANLRMNKTGRKLAGHANLATKPADGITPEMEYIFLLKDSTNLTDGVIDDMASRGWPLEKLKEFREKGGRYCPPRNSIIFSEPQGLEITLVNGVILNNIHQLIIGGKPFKFSR